jgi:hypothetical protein
LSLRAGDDTLRGNPEGFPMMRVMSLTMCLILPMSAFAQDAAPTPPLETAAPAAAAPGVDQPTQSSLVPTDAAPNGATEGTRSCGMSRGCGRGAKSAVKVVIITGLIGTIVTAAAVGIAVGVARAQPGAGQVPR